MAPSIKTPVGNAPIIPVLTLMIGGYIAWFAIHYFKSDVAWPTDPIKSVLAGGTVPAASHAGEQEKASQESAFLAQAAGGAAVAGATAAGGGTTGSPIANDAMKYVGQGYIFGGNANAPGNWDCSSFTSYVLGHDLDLALPGGHWGDPGFPPRSHGPTTGSYALYGTPIEGSQVQPGDLVVWQTHMGIAISATQIVSARDEAEGTGVSSIAGTTSSLGEPEPHYRRVPGVAAAGVTSGVAAAGQTGVISA